MCKSRAKGFTLLEMMVVIIIIGTIMAIAIPRMNDMFEVNLKSAIRKLGGAIQYAFNESVIKQTPLRLNFDLVQQEYWISYLSVSGETGEFLEIPSDLVQRQQLPDGVSFMDVITPHDIEKKTEGDVFINFYPTGFAEKGVIHMTSNDGRQFTLLVKSLTGDITVYDRYIDFVDLVPGAGSGSSSGSSISTGSPASGF